MNASWRETTLGRLLRVKHGFAFKGEHFTDVGEQILLTPGNFQAEGGLKLKGGREKYYNGPVPSDFVLAEGDLLVAMTDLTQDAPILGSAAFVPHSGRFLHNQRLGKVVNINTAETVTQFVYYLFNSPGVRAQIRATATGATVRHTAPERIYAARVQLPSIDEQRRIAGILSGYDDLIENCERRIRLLEAMTRTLYREWFASVRDRRTTTRCPVTQFVDVNPRVFVQKGTDVAFVPMGSLSNDTMEISDIEQRPAGSGSKFMNGDTLFARITPCLENGKTGLVQFLPEGDAACGSTEFIVLRGRTVPSEFVYCLARSDEFREHAIKSMTGATGRQRVQEACFDQFFISTPDRERLARFSEFAGPAFRLAHTLHARSTVLRRTRDLLLTRLLSGDLSAEDTA